MESGRKKLYLPYLHRGKKRNDKKQQNKNHSILGGCSPAKPKEHPCTSSFKKKKKTTGQRCHHFKCCQMIWWIFLCCYCLSSVIRTSREAPQRSHCFIPHRLCSPQLLQAMLLCFPISLYHGKDAVFLEPHIR